MALFGITRYFGEEDREEDVAEEKGAGGAVSILDKLNKQAVQRKKERLSLGSEIKEAKTPITHNEVSIKSKKLKKRSLEGDNDKPELRGRKNETDTPKSKKARKTKSPKLAPVPPPESDESSDSDSQSECEASPTKPSVLDSKGNTGDTDSEDSEEESPDMTLHEEEMDEGKEEDGESEGEDDEETSGLITKEKGQRHEEIGGFTVIGDVFKKKKDKVHRVLPDWLANPAVINNNIRTHSTPLDEFQGLEDDLREKLSENGITHLFPVQAQVIPVLMENSPIGHLIGKAGFRPSDICCSAPTGSGKTLAFVLPIVQVLRRRVVCGVRALVVLPVRDLAVQVYKVFQTYCKGTKLKVGLITGQKGFQNEQQTLVKNGPQGYRSLVDIVVATPGRLVDHINQTPGFSLKQLRYLVIDEADRMMEEIKQDWLTTVERAVYDSTPVSTLHTAAPFFSSHRSRPRPPSLASLSKMEIPLQKLLFSATLSQNPEKLQQLNLFQPKLFTSVVKELAQDKSESTENVTEEGDSKDGTVPNTGKDSSGEFVGKYTTPSGLTEFYVECSAAEKPLVLLHFVLTMKFKNVICFTNSVESTHRLYTLLKQIEGLNVKEFSSNMHAVKRTKVLKQFSSGKIDLLICSDAMARGMDVENAQYVISYESAPFLKTYIHRVGRTARAGRVGTAITLLEKKQIYHFKKMLKEAGKTGAKEMKIKPADKKNHIESFKEALKEMPHILKAEKKKS